MRVLWGEVGMRRKQDLLHFPVPGAEPPIAGQGPGSNPA
jgi:hypothetical protein